MTTPITPDDAFNRALLANTRPSGYQNPAPKAKYNLVVIGAGPAGLVAAAGAAGLGAKVALIERDFMGGDCLNSGCVPSKALIRASRAASEIGNSGQFGIGASIEKIDFGRVMERLRRLRADISKADSVKRFTELGVDVFLGEARFIGANEVQVGAARLPFARAAVTAGSLPEVPDIQGLKVAGYETNLSIFNLTELPRRLLVIGGGPIGCELSQAFQRLGSSVTVIQRGERLLPKDDPDASKLILKKLTSEGVRVLFSANVKTVTRAGSEIRASCEVAGTSEEIVCDRILVAAGRKVDVSSLNLAAAGIDSDKHGIVVDDYLRTTNQRVYAAGDCCSNYKFTHAADAMARILIRNALFPGGQRVSRLVIPWATYTEPEVAQAGLTLKDAEKNGIEVDVLTVALHDVDRAILDSQEEGFAKLILQKGSGRILGATLVAVHAGDMIGEAALAITNKVSAGALASTIHPYPTQAEAWRKLGDAYNRTRLTPALKSILAGWLRWRL